MRIGSMLSGRPSFNRNSATTVTLQAVSPNRPKVQVRVRKMVAACFQRLLKERGLAPRWLVPTPPRSCILKWAPHSMSIAVAAATAHLNRALIGGTGTPWSWCSVTPNPCEGPSRHHLDFGSPVAKSRLHSVGGESESASQETIDAMLAKLSSSAKKIKSQSSSVRYHIWVNTDFCPGLIAITVWSSCKKRAIAFLINPAPMSFLGQRVRRQIRGRVWVDSSKCWKDWAPAFWSKTFK